MNAIDPQRRQFLGHATAFAGHITPFEGGIQCGLVEALKAAGLAQFGFLRHAIGANQHANDDLALFAQAFAERWVGGLGVLQVVGIARWQLNGWRCRLRWRCGRRSRHRGRRGRKVLRKAASGGIRRRRRVGNGQRLRLGLGCGLGHGLFLHDRGWRDRTHWRCRWRGWCRLFDGHGRLDELRQHLGWNNQLCRSQQQAALQCPDQADMQRHHCQGNHGIATQAGAWRLCRCKGWAWKGGGVHHVGVREGELKEKESKKEQLAAI